MKNRILSIILTAAMVFSMLPGAVFAETVKDAAVTQGTSLSESVREAQPEAAAKNAAGLSEHEREQTAAGKDAPDGPNGQTAVMDAQGTGSPVEADPELEPAHVPAIFKQPVGAQFYIDDTGIVSTVVDNDSSWNIYTYRTKLSTSQWEVSEDGETFDQSYPCAAFNTSFSGGSLNKGIVTLTFKPQSAVGAGHFYVRAKVVCQENGKADSVTYSDVVEVAVDANKRPAMVINKPKVLLDNGKLIEMDDLGVTVDNPRAAQFDENGQYRQTGFTLRQDLTTYHIRLKPTYNTDDYFFAGWLFHDGPRKGDVLIAPTDESFSAAKYPAWQAYLEGDGWSFEGAIDTYGDFQLNQSKASTKVLQDFSATPVFKVKEKMAYEIQLVQTDGGTISRVRKDGETHTLTAKPQKLFSFSNWEQSTDGGETWTKIEGGAECTVTLTEDTAYRAVFTPVAIESLTIQGYQMTSAENAQWILLADAALTGLPNGRVNYTVKVYEGTDAEGTLLRNYTASDLNGSQAYSLRVSGISRPTAADAAIYVVVSLENGAEISRSYQLSGTLDIAAYTDDGEDFPKTVDLTQLLFMQGRETGSLSVKAMGNPAAEVTYYVASDGENAETIDPLTGAATYGNNSTGRSQTTLIYAARTTDGRFAEVNIVAQSSMAFKLDETPRLAVGEVKEIVPNMSGKINARIAKVESSDPEIVKVELISQTSGWTPLVEKVKLTGVSAGTAALTFTCGSGASAVSWTGEAIVTDPDAEMTGLTVTPETAELQVAQTAALSAVVEPIAAEAAVTWSSADESVATVSETGVVTALKAGTAVITATAVDSKGNTKTASCTVTVKNDPYTVRLMVPKNTVGENGLTVAPAGEADKAAEMTKDSETSGQYDIYTLSLTAGSYTFQAKDANDKSLGGGTFSIPTGMTGSESTEKRTINLYTRMAEFYAANEFAGKKAAASEIAITAKNFYGAVTMGQCYESADGYACYPALLLVNGKALPYDITATPTAEYIAAHKVGAKTESGTAIEIDARPWAMAITLPTGLFTINAPADADVAIYNETTDGVTRIEPGEKKTLADGTVDNVFHVMFTKTMHYRVGGDKYVSVVGTVAEGDISRLVIGMDLLQPEGKTKTTLDRNPKSNSGANMADLYMNVNAEGYLKLDGVNATYQLKPKRNWWGSSSTWNLGKEYYLIEPDFHYTVLNLDGQPDESVVTVDESGVVKAVGKGSAIVLVSYDAMMLNYHEAAKVGKHSYDGYDPNGFFGAIWPENTGVFVVSVGAGDSGITTGMTLNAQLNDGKSKLAGSAIDSELDVIYYLGDSGSYTFTPGTQDVKVSVANPTVSADAMSFTGFKALSAQEDGSYTVPLREGRNIVKLEKNGNAEYQVITAKHVNVTVNGVPLEQATVSPGEAVSLVFDNVYNPVTRMMIYNTDAAMVYTKISGAEGKKAGNARGPYGYYFFPSSAEKHTVANYVTEGTDSSGYSNSVVTVKEPLTVPDDFTEETFTLSGGVFNVAGFSHHLLGSHRDTSLGMGEGLSDNVMAYFGQLPDISIPTGSLEGIRVTKQPDAASYCIGDVFDPSGMEVTADFKKATGEVVTSAVDGYTYDTAPFTQAGTKEITIRYGGKTATVTVTVSDVTLESIAVTTQPAKTEYLVGDKFETDGMVVTAAYSDGSTKAVGAYTCDPETLTAQTKAVTVNYGGKTAAVDVYMVVVTSIEITTPPAKTAYAAGEYFNTEGMVVTAKQTYRNGSVITFTTEDYKVTPARKLEKGDTSVTITYTGADAGPDLAPVTQSITVKDSTSGGSSGGTTPSADSITVSVSYSEKGKTVTGNGDTPLYEVPVTVYDGDHDGKYTMGDAFEALHKEYYSGGKSGYSQKKTDLDYWVTKFWGKASGELSYSLNNGWVVGVGTQIQDGDKLAAWTFADTTEWSDLYTWFDESEYDAGVKELVSFRVNGLNIMQSSEKNNVTAAPRGAKVTVYKNGKAVSALKTVTDDNGEFTVTFPEAGTYTVEVSGSCDYTCSSYGASSGASYKGATVVPARCTVTVSAGGGKDDGKQDGELKFTDVKKGDYCYDAVKWAAKAGVTTGVTETAFCPNLGCTRAQTVTFLWRAMGSPEPKAQNCPFTDVSKTDYYYKAVLWAVETGVATGATETTFNPDAPCTRGQMAAFLYRSAESPAVSGSLAFRDVSSGDYFCDAVKWAAQQGITEGTSAIAFSPEALCTRGQMVTFLYRYLGK